MSCKGAVAGPGQTGCPTTGLKSAVGSEGSVRGLDAGSGNGQAAAFAKDAGFETVSATNDRTCQSKRLAHHTLF